MNGAGATTTPRPRPALPIRRARAAGADTQTDSAARDRLVWLDGIRGAAALFVVLHHLWLAAWPAFPRDTGPWYLGWLLYGHLAVAVFIVVSGFSLALAPMRDGGQLRGGARHFINRRAWRIIPPYWAAIVVSTVVSATLLNSGLGPGQLTKAVAVHGLLVQDVVGSAALNGTFWSIAIEWQIYFLFPLMLLIARRRSVEQAVALTVAAALAAHAIARLGAPFSKLDDLLPQFLALFALGLLAVKLGRDRRADLTRPAAALACVALLAVPFVAIARGSVWTVANYFFVDLVFGLGCACLMYLMLAGHCRPLQRVLARRTSRRLGRFSYSIYLVQGPIVGVLAAHVVGPMHLAPLAEFTVLLVAGVPLVLGLCYGFHLLFEAPFLRLRSAEALRATPIVKLVRSRTARSAVAVPVAAQRVAAEREVA